jgi:hypothetical protein
MRSPEEFEKFFGRYFPEDNNHNSQQRHKRRCRSNNPLLMKERVVGRNAQPIGQDNVGHMLLIKMGWSGGGLGAQGQGIEEPIQPVIRTHRWGLGYNEHKDNL